MPALIDVGRSLPGVCLDEVTADSQSVNSQESRMRVEEAHVLKDFMRWAKN